MRKKRWLFSFIIFSAIAAVSFQNCGESGGFRANSTTIELFSNDIPEDRVVPAFLSNRSIALDNKSNSGSSNWGFGGNDVFYYETDYRATYQSTLVTIIGRNSSAILVVDQDDCQGEKVLSVSEQVTVSSFYELYFSPTLERGSDQAAPQGCSFPRLALDTTRVNNSVDPPAPYIDFEVYFTTPACTPPGELYVSDLNGVEADLAKMQVESFYNAQIDEVCGF